MFLSKVCVVSVNSEVLSCFVYCVFSMSEDSSQSSVEEEYDEYDATPADDVFNIGGERVAMRLGETVSLES